MALVRKSGVKPRPKPARKPAAKPAVKDDTPGVRLLCPKCQEEFMPKADYWYCPKCKVNRSSDIFEMGRPRTHIIGEPTIVLVKERGGRMHYALYYEDNGGILLELPWAATAGSNPTPQEYGAGASHKMSIQLRSSKFKIVEGQDATTEEG